MRSPEINVGLPKTTVESIKAAEKRFESARYEFMTATPDLSLINGYIEKLWKEINYYAEDFEIILREREENGGGINYQQDRIRQMRNAVSKIESIVEEAEDVIASNEILYSPYKAQINAAKKIVAALKTV